MTIYIPTKQWPYVCQRTDCEAQAYHLSTIDEHPLGADRLPRAWALTRQYKCREGHISQKTVWVVKSAAAEATS